MAKKMESFRAYAAALAMFLMIAPGDLNPVPQQTTIVQEMLDDANMCKDWMPFLKSDSMKECDVPILEANQKITSNEFSKFLCYGIHDSMCNICQLSAINAKFQNKTIFSEDVQKNLADNEAQISNQDVSTLCKGLPPPYTKEPYNKTKHMVAQLRTILGDIPACTLGCTDSDGKPKNLCLILHWMYRVMRESYNNSKVLGMPVSPTNKSENNVDPVDPSPKKAEPKLTKIENPVPDKTANATKKGKEEAPKVEQKVEKNPDATPEKSQSPQANSPEESLPEPKEREPKEGKQSQEKLPLDPAEEAIKEENVVDQPEKNEEIPDNLTDPALMDEDDIMTRAKTIAPSNQKNDLYKSDEEDSHPFSYIVLLALCCAVLYISYLSKQKILATVAKMRRSRSRSRRRPSTANYRKLDCTLEEAVNSQCSNSVTQVIY